MPLNQFFDQVWSQNIDSSGQTMRDRAVALVTNGLITQSPSDQSPYNIAVNLPATGILRAIVLKGTTIYLSYEINGNSASWSAHNTQIWPLSDASFTLTFDLEILIYILIPAEAGASLTTNASYNIENANISASNPTAGIEGFLQQVSNFIQDEPTNLFQAAEGEIDSVGGASNHGQPIDATGSFSDSLESGITKRLHATDHRDSEWAAFPPVWTSPGSGTDSCQCGSSSALLFLHARNQD